MVCEDLVGIRIVGNEPNHDSIRLIEFIECAVRTLEVHLKKDISKASAKLHVEVSHTRRSVGGR